MNLLDVWKRIYDDQMSRMPAAEYPPTELSCIFDLSGHDICVLNANFAMKSMKYNTLSLLNSGNVIWHRSRTEYGLETISNTICRILRSPPSAILFSHVRREIPAVIRRLGKTSPARPSRKWEFQTATSGTRKPAYVTSLTIPWSLVGRWYLVHTPSSL